MSCQRIQAVLPDIRIGTWEAVQYESSLNECSWSLRILYVQECLRGQLLFYDDCLCGNACNDNIKAVNAVNAQALLSHMTLGLYNNLLTPVGKCYRGRIEVEIMGESKKRRWENVIVGQWKRR